MNHGSNVKYKKIKLLEESRKENLHELELGKGFLDIPTASYIKEKNDKLGLIKMKSILHCRRHKRMKIQATDLERIHCW